MHKTHGFHHKEKDLYWECKLCEKKIMTRLNVMKKDEFQYHCEICGLGFALSSCATEHRKSAHSEIKHVCQLCGKLFLSEKSLKHHTMLHDPLYKPKEYSCKLCEYVVTTRKHFIRHMRIHAGEELQKFVCDICGKALATKESLRDHLRLTHSSERPFSCLICGKTFKLKNCLRVHGRVHTVERPYSCEVCSKKFKRRSALVIHMKKHTAASSKIALSSPTQLVEEVGNNAGGRRRRRSTSVGEVERNTNCTLCGKKFDDPAKFKRHERFHSEKTVPCPHCNKLFRIYSQVKAHFRFCPKFTTELYECQVCGKKIKKKAAFDLHVKAHSNEFKYKCDICGRGFRSPNSVQLHKHSMHMGVKHSCHHCGKQFSEESHLKNHLSQHDPEYADEQSDYDDDEGGKFTCSICEKAFNSRCGMNVHEETHTNKKPHSCTTCLKTFAQSSHLVIHMRHHTGERPYKCSVCRKGYITETLLKAHVKIHE